MSSTSLAIGRTERATDTVAVDADEISGGRLEPLPTGDLATPPAPMAEETRAWFAVAVGAILCYEAILFHDILHVAHVGRGQ